MLAGGLRPAPLVQHLEIPLLCLPLGPRGTLLGAWLTAIGRTPGCTDVHVVVNTDKDVQAIQGLDDIDVPDNGAHVAISAEVASWRGTGGLVRDLTRDGSADSVVVALEAHCLPPASLEALFRGLDDDQADAVVGTGPGGEPTGLYAFKHEAISSVPALGYFDLKEQLFPRLHEQGRPARVVATGRGVIRVRERSGYLDAVRTSLAATGPRCSSQATVSPSARIEGPCIIEPEVVIEAGAVVNESVVLAGARVCEEAVVSRSVVPAGAVISAGTRLIGDILPMSATGSRETI